MVVNTKCHKVKDKINVRVAAHYLQREKHAFHHSRFLKVKQKPPLLLKLPLLFLM